MACRPTMARLAILIPDMRGGGAERVAASLAEGFLSSGHEVDLLLGQARGELLDQLPSGVDLVDLNASRFRQQIRPLAQYLSTNRPAGLIAMMWPMPVIALAARFLARTTTRIVGSDHAILSDHYRDRPDRIAALRLSTGLFYPRLDHRVTASKRIAEDLARLSGIPVRDIQVIHNPIEMPPEQIERCEQVERHWQGGSRVLSVGSLKQEKRHAILLEAFAKLLERREASLVILGEGPERPKLEALASNLGIVDRVAMPGFSSDPWPYYSSANLLALSSSTEGFGNVLVEAMAVGVPAVSTDCGGPREILRDGEYGQLVPVDDVPALAEAMDLMLARTPDRDGLKARACEFRPEIAVDKYLRLLLDPLAEAQ